MMKYEIKKNTFDVDLEDKKIILDVDSGKYIELNNIGIEIFKLLQEKPLTE